MSALLNMRKLATLRTVHTSLFNLQQSLSNSTTTTSAKCSTLAYDKDPQPLFTDSETQSLLQSMTQMQVDKIYRKRTVDDNSVEYKFMTTEQLEDEFKNTIVRARLQLKMPPLVKVKKDTQRVISKDSALKNFSDTKYVFTDISYGLRQSERKVVVREIDGTLAYAPLATAKRMSQLYVPLNGRKFLTPRMFTEEEHFKRCLDEHKYEFILDRLAVQYEPYEQDYQNLTAKVYQHLNESKQFDMLRSTRHFGPMAFFYAWHRCIDDLLYDMIRRDYLKNGAELIALMYKIHHIPNEYKTVLEQLNKLKPTVEELALAELRKPLNNGQTNNIQTEIQSAIGKTSEDFEADEISLNFIVSYIASKHSLKKVQLELAVQTLKEIITEKKQLYDGLRKAHGVQNSH